METVNNKMNYNQSVSLLRYPLPFPTELVGQLRAFQFAYLVSSKQQSWVRGTGSKPGEVKKR